MNSDRVFNRMRHLSEELERGLPVLKPKQQVKAFAKLELLLLEDDSNVTSRSSKFRRETARTMLNMAYQTLGRNGLLLCGLSSSLNILGGHAKHEVSEFVRAMRHQSKSIRSSDLLDQLASEFFGDKLERQYPHKANNTTKTNKANTCEPDNVNTDEADSANTDEADSVNTGEADSANTGEADSANTGEADSANTGEADSVSTAEADNVNTAQADSVNTAQADYLNTGTTIHTDGA